MKKCFLILAMMFTMCISSFANESNVFKFSEAERYELNVNHRRLACVLDLSAYQIDVMDDIMYELERDMLFARTIKNEDSRNAVMSNAIKKNVKWVHYILQQKQYKKYLMLLNLTLENRGFDIAKLSD